MFQPITTSTKTIAARTGIELKTINTIARDLRITHYEAGRRSWVIEDRLVNTFIEHLEELAA